MIIKDNNKYMGTLGYWGVLEAEREGFYLSIIHLMHVLFKQRKGDIYVQYILVP